MASSCPVIDDPVKGYLHGRPGSTRQVLVWKLDGPSEYDVRRPLTATGTDLLGLVEHSATREARYLGGVFGMVHVRQGTTRHAGHADVSGGPDTMGTP